MVEKGSPHSIALMESGKVGLIGWRFETVPLQLLPGCRVVIADPETRGQCADSHLVCTVSALL